MHLTLKIIYFIVIALLVVIAISHARCYFYFVDSHLHEKNTSNLSSKIAIYLLCLISDTIIRIHNKI